MLPISNRSLPVSGILSFMYYRGKRDDGTDHFHRGIDIPAPLGTPVLAAEGGVVTHAIRQYTPGFSGYGKVVVIKGNGIYYLYAHLNDVSVSVGQSVSVGEKIGEVGYTAFPKDNPTGNLANRSPHLHFEAAEKPYPMPSEAARLNPLIVLGQSTAGAGIGLLALAAFGMWLLYRKRR